MGLTAGFVGYKAQGAAESILVAPPTPDRIQQVEPLIQDSCRNPESSLYSYLDPEGEPAGETLAFFRWKNPVPRSPPTLSGTPLRPVLSDNEAEVARLVCLEGPTTE